MSTVTANGIDIYYELWGEGPPLVMAHGFCGCTDEWRALVLPLAKRRCLLLYDVRGHGRSSAPEDPALYSMPILAADQAALMRALGIERAHVGGLSMGGWIAWSFALAYPEAVAGLILSDAAGYLGDKYITLSPDVIAVGMDTQGQVEVELDATLTALPGERL